MSSKTNTEDYYLLSTQIVAKYGYAPNQPFTHFKILDYV